MIAKKQLNTLADVLTGVAWLAMIFAVYGMFGQDIVLASTQWLLVGAFIMANAIYFQNSAKNAKNS